MSPDPDEVAREFGEDPVPRDDAPQIPGEFGVDTDPYTEDDSLEVEDDDEDDR